MKDEEDQRVFIVKGNLKGKGDQTRSSDLERIWKKKQRKKEEV